VRGVWFTPSFVCLFFHIIYKPDAARIIKLDVEMFHDETWKFIDSGFKRSKVKVTSQKHCRRGTLHSCECWLLLVLYVWLLKDSAQWDYIRPRSVYVPARRYASAVLAIIVSVRPSVRPSVTHQYCTKTAKSRITQTTPYDSPGTSFMTTTI